MGKINELNVGKDDNIHGVRLTVISKIGAWASFHRQTLTIIQF